MSTVVRALLARRIPTPWIMVDELLYSDLAKNLVEQGRFLYRGVPVGGLGNVYPALVSPAWYADSVATAYGVAKAINSVLMSLAAVPVYLWARRLVSPALALVAAGLVLLLPAFVYTGTLMTENAAFPAFCLATFAIALALERPTLATQAAALGAVALATAVRVQFVLLFGVVVLATALKVALDLRVRAGRPRDLVRPYAPMLAALAALAGAYVGWKRAQGADLSTGLGSYADATGVHYSWHDGYSWAVEHLAELSLAVGVVPLAALVLLALLGALRGLPSPAERSLVAVAIPTVVLVIVQVALFASRFAFRIEERNMFYVMPLLLLAFVVWIDRGLPRPPVAAAVAALGSAALVLAIPLASRLDHSIYSDTFGLVPLLRLSLGIDEIRWIVIFGAFDAALAFLFLPRRMAAVVLPLALAAYFVVVTTAVSRQAEEYARNVRGTVPTNASWIDRRVGTNADVAYVFTPSADPFQEGVGLWQLAFWNRSLGATYTLGVDVPGGIPQVPAGVDPATGRLASDDPALARSRYVLARTSFALAERPIEEEGQLTLYAVRPPLQVERTVEGVYGEDGSMASDAAYNRYSTPDGRRGELIVSVSRAAWNGPDRPGRVVVEIGRLAAGRDGAPTISRVTARRTWTIHSGAIRGFRLPAPRPPFRATVHVGSTFVPADFNDQGDTREIGAWVAFAFAPRR